MATAYYQGVYGNGTNVVFRTWISNLQSQLVALGLVQTADTGQINTSTVVTPSSLNTSAGYQIFRFADSTIYIKLEYGAGSDLVNAPQIWVTAGTGSNGSGTITGQTSTRATCAGNPVNSSLYSFNQMCVTADCVTFALGYQSIPVRPSPQKTWGAYLAIHKTVASTGAATTTGFGVLRLTTAGPASLQCVRTAATAATYLDNTFGIVAIPGQPLTTTRRSDGFLQAYECWINVPDGQIFNGACVTLINEHPFWGLANLSLASNSATAKNYVALGTLLDSAVSVGGYSDTRYCWAMYWN